MPESGYQPSQAMQDHLTAAQDDPSKAMRLPASLRAELDQISPETLQKMAGSVKYSKGTPIHLTDEQNARFRQQNQHLPTFSKTDALIPKAPVGKYSLGAGGSDNAMSNAWAKFEGSFEAFKAEIFKPVPAELRIGKQEWLVQACTAKDQVGVAILNGGSFNDPDAAMAHAQRLQNVYPFFDFHVVSQWAWVAMPPAEDTMRGVQRTYKDKNLDAIMREHFINNSQGKEKQLKQIQEVQANKGPREEEEPEFPRNEIHVDMIDDDAPQGEVVAREES